MTPLKKIYFSSFLVFRFFHKFWNFKNFLKIPRHIFIVQVFRKFIIFHIFQEFFSLPNFSRFL